MKYEYKVTQPSLPSPDKRSNPSSAMMDYRDMNWWMNNMSGQGWEFVGHGTTQLPGNIVQSWWVFRREKKDV